MKNNRREFGLRLKKARTAAGISGYKLAMLLDVEPPNITHWENGRSYPRIDKLIRISELLEVSIDWLLLGKNEKENEDHEERSQERSQERS